MSRLLIATDEAGYGPKLGPLVVVATAWQLPATKDSGNDLAALFAPLATPQQLAGRPVIIADSKTIFHPSSGLESLHTIVSAVLNWVSKSPPMLNDVLASLAPLDTDALSESPWLLSGEPARAMLGSDQTAPLVKSWSMTGLKPTMVRARVITARQFNRRCGAGYNKADLLSELTIGLVRSIVDNFKVDASSFTVCCDRHGGRRYYGGVLQHLFPESMLQVVAESKQQSRYRLTGAIPPMEIAFTVKGDSFAPVAMSSIIAKYLRERLMESFNAYFRLHHRSATPLKPTAGYPVDADRFLKDIDPIIRSLNIDRAALIRSR